VMTSTCVGLYNRSAFLPITQEGDIVRKVLAFSVFAVLLLSGSSAFGQPIISINASDIAASYTISGGTGTMAFNDNVTVIVEYADNSQFDYTGSSVSLSTTLVNDWSSGGFARGDFAGGQIVISQGTTNLLTCNLADLSIVETPRATSNLLAGAGSFSAASGTLASQFGSTGEIFMLEFQLSVPVSSFATGFTGRADMSLTPTPEPATMGLLGLGGALLLRRRRA
jgi:hypothetical protein